MKHEYQALTEREVLLRSIYQCRKLACNSSRPSDIRYFDTEARKLERRLAKLDKQGQPNV